MDKPDYEDITHNIIYRLDFEDLAKQSIVCWNIYNLLNQPYVVNKLGIIHNLHKLLTLNFNESTKCYHQTREFRNSITSTCNNSVQDISDNVKYQ